MENVFKKFLYSGVGFVSLATEKFKAAVNELIKDGKLSEEEGKNIVENFSKSSEERKKVFEKDFGIAVENILHNFKFAKSEDVERLRNRITVLENLLSEDKTEPKEKTSKKKKSEPKDTDIE